jgi:hypothetical protein
MREQGGAAMSDPVIRHLFGCCSYEFSWTPGLDKLEPGWGTEQEAIENSFVASAEYDSLEAKIAEQDAVIDRLRIERDLLLFEIRPDDYAKIKVRMVKTSETPDAVLVKQENP